METQIDKASASLLKRVFLFLEDEEWSRADEYCEKVLDMDPENPQAYLGKLMAELRVKNQKDLQDQAKPFDSNNNYQKILRFGDEQLKTTLIGYIDHINTINGQKGGKNTRKIAIIATSIACAIIAFIILLTTVIIPNGKYNDAVALMDAGQYTEAIAAFETLDGYKDSANKVVECNTAILDSEYNNAMALMDAGQYTEAIAAFEALDDYKDSADKVIECKHNNAYNDAIAQI